MIINLFLMNKFHFSRIRATEIKFCSFVKGHNIESKSTIWPILHSSEPIRTNILYICNNITYVFNRNISFMNIAMFAEVLQVTFENFHRVLVKSIGF